jgi:ribulose-5-phosphate 4-epimerase/fuculose-1-phosphate aldolase
MTVGRDLKEAYFMLERVEHFAWIFFIANSLGGVRKLSKKQIEKLKKLKFSSKVKSK